MPSINNSKKKKMDYEIQKSFGKRQVKKGGFSTKSKVSGYLNSMNKSGLSAVVATTLLIVLVIASASILYLTVNQLTKEPLESPQLSCPELQTTPPISIGNACYNSETKDTEIILNKITNQQINLIEFILDFKPERQNFKCDNECGNCKILTQNSKTYYINSETKPKEITIKTNECELETQKILDC